MYETKITKGLEKKRKLTCFKKQAVETEKGVSPFVEEKSVFEEIREDAYLRISMPKVLS
jgi:hypothetical protein